MCSESHAKATNTSGVSYHCKYVSEVWSCGPLVLELQLSVLVYTSPGKETATFFGTQSKTGTLFKGNYRLCFYTMAEAAIMSCSIHSGQQLRSDAFPRSMEEFKIEEGHPWCCFSCFEGTCSPWYLPHPWITTALTHHWPNLHPVQALAEVFHRMQCNHTWESSGNFLYSGEICPHFVNIVNIFFSYSGSPFVWPSCL